MARDRRSARLIRPALPRDISLAKRQPRRGKPSSWSPGPAAITPSRSRTQPALAGRRYAVTLLIGGSDLPAGVQGCKAAGVIAPRYAREASLADHIGKVLLVGKRADGFHQILVGLCVTGHHLADTRNSVERTLIINHAEPCHADFRPLQAQEAAASL